MNARIQKATCLNVSRNLIGSHSSSTPMSTVLQMTNKIVRYEGSILLLPEVCSRASWRNSSLGRTPGNAIKYVLCFVYLQNTVLIYQIITLLTYWTVQHALLFFIFSVYSWERRENSLLAWFAGTDSHAEIPVECNWYILLASAS
jgi:hypothetical protein